jgi:hypothetical protein
MENLGASGEWKLRPLGQGRYELTETANGRRPQNGRVSFDLTHRNPSDHSPKLRSRFVARFLSGDKHRIKVDTQDLEIMDYASSMSLPVAKDAVFTRSAACMEGTEAAAKGEMPQRHDEVIVNTNEAGEVTAVKARYGYEKGRIKKFESPEIVGEPSNGIIEMESGTDMNSCSTRP